VLASFNVQSMLQTGRRRVVLQAMRERGVHVCGLQGTGGLSTSTRKEFTCE